MLPPHLLRLLLHHHHPPSSTLLPFLAQPLQLSVSFTPKETRSCQKEAALKELQFHNQRLFFVFYTTGKCVCVCVSSEKRLDGLLLSARCRPPRRVCQFENVTFTEWTCWASLETSLNLFNSFDVMWLFRVTASPHPKKKQLKLKKRKLWVTLIEMLTCNYFCICHFWRCKKNLQTAYKHEETVAGIRLKKKKKVTVILPHVIPSSSSVCVCVGWVWSSQMLRQCVFQRPWDRNSSCHRHTSKLTFFFSFFWGFFLRFKAHRLENNLFERGPRKCLRAAFQLSVTTNIC